MDHWRWYRASALVGLRFCPDDQPATRHRICHPDPNFHCQPGPHSDSYGNTDSFPHPNGNPDSDVPSTRTHLHPLADEYRDPIWNPDPIKSPDLEIGIFSSVSSTSPPFSSKRTMAGVKLARLSTMFLPVSKTTCLPAKPSPRQKRTEQTRRSRSRRPALARVNLQ